MIDADVHKTLITTDPDIACTIAGGIAYVHSRIFVVELPEDAVARVKWPGKGLSGIVNWRTWLPAGAPAVKATTMPSTAPNGADCIELMSLSSSDARYMQSAYYRFVQDQLDDPSFRIMQYTAPPGEVSGIAIYDGERWVGAVGAYLGLLPLVE